MSKSWMLTLATAMGLMSSTVMGQYPSGYDNFGPSAYPVTLPQNVPQVPLSFNAQQTPTYGIVGPNNGQYHLVGTQQAYGSGIIENTAQPPATAAMQSAVAAQSQHATPPPVTAIAPHSGTPMTTAPMTTVPAPNMAGSHVVMPGASCQTCGPAPMVQTYQAPPQVMTAPSPAYVQSVAPNCTSCGPAPVSGFPTVTNYAPSVGYSTPSYTATQPSRVQLGQSVSKPWFFGAGTLIFNRVDHKSVPLSFADNAYSPDILTTRDARQNAAIGFETTIGRYFNCGRNALAFTYWGIFPDDQTVTRQSATSGLYRSRIPFQYMEMSGTPSAPGVPYSVYDWYDNAFTHSLTRSFDYHNVEINLLGFAAGNAARTFNFPTAGSLFSNLGHRGGSSSCGYCGGAGCGSCASSCGPTANACNSCAPSKYATGPCCLTPPKCGSRLNLTWIAGLRWFHFSDNLLYAASLGDTVVNRAADDMYYEVNTTNDLVGFQTGGRIDYCLGSKVNIYGTAKAGIYNNRSTLYSTLGTDFETAYLNDTRAPANPDNGMRYAFDDTKNNVAFLTELGTGFGYRVSSKWTATAGYRAIIASGVATAPDNVRTTFANFDHVRDFDNCGTLILHGFNFSGIYNY